jgi:hypothetical protein
VHSWISAAFSVVSSFAGLQLSWTRDLVSSEVFWYPISWYHPFCVVAMDIERDALTSQPSKKNDGVEKKPRI